MLWKHRLKCLALITAGKLEGLWLWCRDSVHPWWDATMWDERRSVPGARKCPVGCGSSGASARVWVVLGSVDLEAMGGSDAASAGKDQGDSVSQAGRGCVAAIQVGYFRDQQPG